MKIMSYPPRITRGLAGLVLCATCLASATDGLQVGNGEWKVYMEDDGLTTTQPFRDGILPADGQYFWIGPGRFDRKRGASSAIKALWIDRVEMSAR